LNFGKTAKEPEISEKISSRTTFCKRKFLHTICKKGLHMNEFPNIQKEAHEFNRLLDEGKVSKKDLQEKLVDPKISPEAFLERLRAEKDGELLLYLISIPGTCSYITNKERFEVTRELLKNGESILPEAKADGVLSLHVALSNNISTMVNSDWNWAWDPNEDFHFDYDIFEKKGRTRRRGVGGLILKPEFLQKLGCNPNDSEWFLKLSYEDFEQFSRQQKQTNPDIDRRDIHFIRGMQSTQLSKENVFSGRKVEIDHSSQGREGIPVIVANDGIRAATFSRDGQTNPVPITPNDVAFLFEVELLEDEAIQYKTVAKGRDWEKVRFFRVDGREVADEDLDKIRSEAKEMNLWEKYSAYYDLAYKGASKLARRRGWINQKHE